MAWPVRSVPQSRFHVRKPKMEALAKGKAIAAFEGHRHIDRVSHTDQVMHGRQQPLPKRQRQTIPRVFPAPRLGEIKLLFNQAAAALPEVRQLPGDLPTGHRCRRLVPAPTNPRKNLFVQLT